MLAHDTAFFPLIIILARERPKLIVFPPCESVLMKVPPAVAATETVSAKLPAPQGVDGMG